MLNIHSPSLAQDAGSAYFRYSCEALPYRLLHGYLLGRDVATLDHLEYPATVVYSIFLVIVDMVMAQR